MSYSYVSKNETCMSAEVKLKKKKKEGSFWLFRGLFLEETNPSLSIKICYLPGMKLGNSVSQTESQLEA